MANVIFKVGTWEQFKALETKNAETLYWLYDVQRVYKGDALFASGAEATTSMAGLLSAEDKAKLDSIVVSSDGEAIVIDLSALDASIQISDTETGKAIGVALSAVAGNALELKDDGLFVPVSAVALDADLGNGLVLGASGLGLNLATATSAGAMSAEDKSLLDSLADTYATKDEISALEDSCTWGEL